MHSASLKAIQEVLDDPLLKTKAAGNTYWLSHDQAVSTIRWILLLFTAHLEKQAAEKGDALAIGLSRVIKTYYFVASTYLFSDISPGLVDYFKNVTLTFSKIQVHVSNTIEVLEILKTPNGPYMQKLQTALNEKLYGCAIVNRPHGYERNTKMKFYLKQLLTSSFKSLTNPGSHGNDCKRLFSQDNSSSVCKVILCRTDCTCTNSRL